MSADGVSFDAAVQEFLRAIVVPRRLREARVADRLSQIQPTMVPTRWGDVAAWRLGLGPAVLLVHGWEDDNSLWSPLVDELDRRQRSMVAFDLPGHGASGGDWAVSFEGSDTIEAVTEALAGRWGCGSFGGLRRDRRGDGGGLDCRASRVHRSAPRVRQPLAALRRTDGRLGGRGPRRPSGL
jgi:hypothetical protein